MPEDTPTKAKLINVFVDKMMADKGVSGAALKDRLKTELDERVEQAMVRALPDEKLVELDGMLDSDVSDDEIEKFFKESGVNFVEVVERTMAEFRKSFLSDSVEAV